MIFVAAAVTDVIDGRLARRSNQVTDLGKLLDPIADKLLLFATLGPIWWISRERQALYDIPDLGQHSALGLPAADRPRDRDDRVPGLGADSRRRDRRRRAPAR